jgi:glycine cleavage system H protein
VNIPGDLLYTKEHEWVRVAGDVAEIGITDYAQGELGDVVFVELPETGKVVKPMGPFGTVAAVNGLIESDAGVVNRDPYGDGWMIKVKMSNPADLNGLLKPEQYKQLLEG